MFPRTTSARNRAFSLTELLTVVGLVALLLSLLAPVISKVRAASSNTMCLANIRQMGTAWSAYTMENRGRFPDYVWHTPATPEAAWNGYWPGILEKNGVTTETLLCPAAREGASQDKGGFGSATRAWTGRYVSDGSAVRLSDTMFRSSSYGYNRYLTVNGGSGRNGAGNTLAALPSWSNTPVMFDCAFADALPMNSTPSVPAAPPPDLTGAAVTDTSPHHWRFLLARHGRGVNVVMADGSARWVRLDDAYQLSWNSYWTPYRLRLPAK